MTPQTELLELIVKTAEENCDLDTPISLEELPAEGGAVCGTRGRIRKHNLL